MSVAMGGGPPEEPNRSRAQTLWAWLLPRHIQRIFIPPDVEEQLVPGEEVLLEIHLAWYRNVFSLAVARYAPALLVLALSLSMIVGMLSLQFNYDAVLMMRLPFILLIATAVYALYERFQYLQWRLIKTNNRIIISMPQPDAWYLVDNIDLTNNPSVIDSNWSDNQAKRFIQALTGARDLYISLQGLQFVAGTARVKDALVMPDVMAEDAERLKQMVFTGR